MREIKFRAWEEASKRMLDWDYFQSIGYDAFFYNGKNPLVRMQFTGLHDKNGKEIYEGDIVKCLDGQEGFITQIVWELCGLRLKDTLLGNIVEGWGADMEVIGNIYENPELLPDKDK